MGFLRVVEVFPPLLSPDDPTPVDMNERVERFVSGVKRIKELCDIVLVADIKNPKTLKLSTVEAAALLEKGAGVKAAPVIVARDSNRPRVLSDILTAYSLGLSNIMLAWGDNYPSDAAAKNVHDFRGLAEVISEARAVAERVGVQARLLAPVDLESLKNAEGVRITDERLEAGADLLLAQPPTTDPAESLAMHSALIQSVGLKDKVLPGVFPFRDRTDVVERSKYFGWSLPMSVYAKAAEGEEALLALARDVAGGVRKAGFPGVYLSTRGVWSIARSVFGSD